MKKSFCFWSDNWWIENDMAWLLPGNGQCNALLQMDMKKHQCNFIAELPEGIVNGFRLNPRCLKCGNEVFCMPDTSSYIWVWRLEVAQFQKIRILNPNKKRVSIVNFWKCGKYIFAVAIGLKQVIKINIQEKRIENYYDLCNDVDEKISLSIKVDEHIYIVSSVSNRIYQFDINTEDCITYTIPNVVGGLRTICSDGMNFWLSGYRKEIYIWNKESNTTEIIDNFPPQFGIYNFCGTNEPFVNYDIVQYNTPTFVDSIILGEYIWFIPFQTNNIIYIHRETHEISVFEMDGEDETEKSINENTMKHKYLLEYVKDNRYIGLFSLKNNCILEIDTEINRMERKSYLFSEDCLKIILKLYDKCQRILLESEHIDRLFFEEKLMACNRIRKDNELDNIGRKIYKEILDF